MSPIASEDREDGRVLVLDNGFFAVRKNGSWTKEESVTGDDLKDNFYPVNDPERVDSLVKESRKALHKTQNRNKRGLSTQFDEALAFASKLHRTQKRKKTNIPYIGHLLSVAGLVIDYGGTEDEAIAALLHDAVEDQGGKKTLEKIRKRFGKRVAEIVSHCSDTDVTPKPPWKERKLAYIASIKGVSASVRLVSAADKLHNASTILKDIRLIGDKIWERFNASKEESLWYYRSLVEAFMEAGRHPIVDELDRVVAKLEIVAAKTST